MYLDIEKRSEEFAAAVLSVDENARGPIATAFVCGANEMLEAIEKNHYIVEATRGHYVARNGSKETERTKPLSVK